MAHTAKARRNASGANVFRLAVSAGVFAVQRAECAGNDACQHRRAGEGMQRRAMKSHERARAAEVARIVEIGREAGNDHHGRAEPRQALPSGAGERERRQRMCERFHDFVLPGEFDLCAAGVTIESASGTIRNAMGSGPTGSPST